MIITTTPRTTSTAVPPPDDGRLARYLTAVSEWLAAHSVTALRISLGLVIAGFGALKYVPGASPAEELVMQTTEALTLGVVDGRAAVLITALLETLIGLSLLTGHALRPCLVVMAGWLGGIMMPVVLFPGQMFPGGLPTIEAQYVLKDVILIAAAAVVAATALGARMVTDRSVRTR